MADYQYINSTGVIVPDTSNILSDVQTEYKSVLGADLIVTPDTPQGLLITAEALARDEVVNNNAAMANQINPNVAGGVFLDAIMALTGMQRTQATKTLVSAVTLAGVAGTVIPAGSQAEDTSGDIFELLSTVTLDVSGNGVGDFAAVDIGPISCTMSSLNRIVTNVLGWETVNNPTAGVLGQSTQSDQAARALRLNTLGFQGNSLPVAITSALYNVSGMQSLWFQENTAATTQTINGISMVAHSIYVCVNGGSDLDVAAALLSNKSLGCAWNGTTTVNIEEIATTQIYPVKFSRAAQIGILVRVTSPNGDSSNIIAAILAYANGQLEGDVGFVVGADVSPWELAGAINRQYPGIYVSKVEVSYSSSVSYTTNLLAIAVSEIATVVSAGITVITA
jgi:hypothetical protein